MTISQLKSGQSEDRGSTQSFLDTQLFGSELKKMGFSVFSGVPCSLLKDLINYAVGECDFQMAANEGDAIAICAGANLAGRRSVFLCQNSGLTNATSPIVSLLKPFKIPILGFVSLRGEPGCNDEPQHQLMGKITGDLLTLMDVPWSYLSTDDREAAIQLEKAVKTIERNEPYFFIVKKNTFSKYKLTIKPSSALRLVSLCTQHKAQDTFPLRMEALKTIREAIPQAAFFATTGYTGRELYELGDSENQFYMVGSMGCVSSLALGAALAKPGQPMIAIDGDGAFLMRLGAITSLTAAAPSNLLHILLDNGLHESTGGQPTNSNRVDFIKLAESTGYPHAHYTSSIIELGQRILDWKQSPALTFLYLRTRPGVSDTLTRPNIDPPFVTQRMKRFLQNR